MKKLPSLLAAAALIGAGTTGFAVSAVAKEKKAEVPKEQQLQLSKEIREQVIAADAAIQTRNPDTAEPLVAVVEAAAKTEDERYMAAALRLNVEKLKLQRPGASEQSLRAPLDALIANSKTPPKDQATFNYQRGALAFNARDYKGALTYFERAKALGSAEPNLPLITARARAESGDIAGGTAALEQSIAATTAAGGKADEQLYRYAIAQSNKAGNGTATVTWIQRLLEAYPTKKNWRDMAVAYGIQGQSMAKLEKQQKLDLFRMLRAGNALADQYDYEQYARWSFDVGLPFEAKTIIAEGQRSGKIPTGSDDAKQIVTLSNASIANEGSLATLETRARSGSGKLALATADGYLGSDNYAKAIDLYRLALQKGGVDADAVNLRLGIALARSGDKEGARTAFAAVKSPTTVGVAKLWTTFLDHPPVA